MIQTYFDNKFIGNQELSFGKEYLLTSGNGAYCASTVAGCNTRKYHGILVIEQPHLDDDNHVIVSTIDEQVGYKHSAYELGTHLYPHATHPKGYKAIHEFFARPAPMWIYQIDDCVMTKEIMMVENESSVMIRYSVAEGSDKVLLNLTPFLAFRNAHKLCKANSGINKKLQAVENGIKAHLRHEYSPLFIQTSQKSEFVPAPDWYYNIEYPCELARGYDYKEDLFVPGYLSVKLKKGDKLVVYAGMNECNPKSLAARYSAALKKKPELDSERNCLLHAAQQFVIKTDDHVKIKAGYYWFGTWGRDTFMSLPGLLLVSGHIRTFREVIKSSLADLKDGLFPNIGKGKTAVYNSVDAPLWFVWAIQQYGLFTGNDKNIWKEYGKPLKEIMNAFRAGKHANIMMDSDGLIDAGQDGVALTWLDALVGGQPVTQRMGKAVEINALWYNAICFCTEMARIAGDEEFTTTWEPLKDKVKQAFMTCFWNEDRQYLADYVRDGIADWSVRPNQVLAISLPYSPVPNNLRAPILNIVRDELLTSKGLRTLAPNDKKFKAVCEGSQESRDMAYHQGTVWPWLIGHYAEGCINTLGFNGVLEIEQVLNDCKSMLGDQCLFTVGEIYNGGHPDKQVGAVAQAWSVAEILRMDYLLIKFKQNEEVCQASAV